MDYFSGTTNRDPPKPEESSRLRLRWWASKGAECAKLIQSQLKTLQDLQSPRVRQQVINQGLYGNRRLTAVQSAARMRLLAQQSTARQYLISYNAVQSIIDTATSKIGETKPRPYFLTSGGNYKQQRKAKRLNKYIDGVFYETKTYQLTPLAFRDSAIDGDGLIFVDVRGGKVRHECVSSMEVWCDDAEAQYGKPLTMYRTKSVDREALAAMFPKSKQQILNATVGENGVMLQRASDMVNVVESWRLGYCDDEDKRAGGWHAIALTDGSGHMLVEPEEWPHDFFPFAKLPWCAPPTGCGYWGQALAEQLQGEQIELNKELQLIQRCMHMMGMGKVLVPVGSKIVSEHINNEIWSLLYYAGAKEPSFQTPPPIHASFFENVPRIIERMERKAGVNEMAVAGKKPVGIDSGRGLRELEDQQSDRFRTTQAQYDAFHLQLAEIDVALSIEAAEKGLLDAVKVPNKGSFDSIDFSKDLRGLKRSEFTLQCYSVSRLPKDPAGRLETIQDHIAAGIISLRQGRKLLDFPDLETVETMADAQEALIQKMLDGIVDEGEYETPEPVLDLVLAKEMVTEYIVHFMALDLEEDRMDMLRNWSMQVDELMTLALPEMTAPAAGMNPAQAVPEAPPTSDLLPVMGAAA